MTDEFTPMTPTMSPSSNGAMTASTPMAAIDQLEKAHALCEGFRNKLHTYHRVVKSLWLDPTMAADHRLVKFLETLTETTRLVERFASEAMDAFKKEKQRERQQPPGNKQERKQHPAQPASSGSIKLDEEFLKLIKLRDGARIF